jgi:hypothetical protein
LPLQLQLEYLLPYAAYHENRDNWRPLMFAKFFALVAEARSTVEAMTALLTPAWTYTQPNAFLDWTGHTWSV